MTKKILILIICFSFIFLSWNWVSNIKKIPLIDYKYTKVFDVESEETVLFRNVMTDKLNVIIFHSLDCPFNKIYHDKLNLLIEESDSINFIFINSNPSEIEENFSITTIPSFTYSKENSYYFLDKTRSIKRICDIKKNGTCLICQFKKSSSSIEIFYQGPVDNSPQNNESNSSEDFLETAISNALNGKETKYKGFQTGCRILNH